MTQEKNAMNQLTIRGFDEELDKRIRELARKEGISLNRAALRLMRRGAGLGKSARGQDVVGSTLDDLIGTWSDDQAREFMDAVDIFEQIDESMWK